MDLVLVAGLYWRNYQEALRKHDKKAAAHWKKKYDDHMKAWSESSSGETFPSDPDEERLDRIEERLEKVEALLTRSGQAEGG